MLYSVKINVQASMVNLSLSLHLRFYLSFKGSDPELEVLSNSNLEQYLGFDILDPTIEVSVLKETFTCWLLCNGLLSLTFENWTSVTKYKYKRRESTSCCKSG